MKHVIKVSIGNIAFTLEEDAHKMLSDYLNDLNAHYKNNINGKEIVDGIEERISELFLEKAGKDTIIEVYMVREVIDILGRPEVIDEESGESAKNQGQYNRKLYRDTSNVVVGGVCSGLGAYFRREPALFRTLFVVLTIFFAIFGWGYGGGFFVLLYIAFWIIIPPARSYEDRCKMKGESPTIESIQDNVEKGVKEVAKGVKRIQDENPGFWKMVGTVLAKFSGVILVFVGVVGVVSLIIALLGYKIWGLAFPLSALSFLSIFSNVTLTGAFWLKLFLLISIFTPFVGALYSGILLLFGFKSPKWRPGLIIFIIWVIGLVGLLSMGFGTATRYMDTDSKRVSEAVNLTSDTLYIEYNDVSKWDNNKVYIEAGYHNYKLYFLNDSNKENYQIICYPEVSVYNNEREASEIEMKTNYFINDMSLAEIRSITQTPFYTLEGNTLRIDPKVYDAEHPIKEAERNLNLYLPENVKVIIKEPIFHSFDNHFEYTNIKWLKMFDW